MPTIASKASFLSLSFLSLFLDAGVDVHKRVLWRSYNKYNIKSAIYERCTLIPRSGVRAAREVPTHLGVLLPAIKNNRVNPFEPKRFNIALNIL